MSIDDIRRLELRIQRVEERFNALIWTIASGATVATGTLLMFIFELLTTKGLH